MNSRLRNRLFHLVLFALFGALMYASKAALQFLPNIHVTGAFIITFTAIYRAKALIPIYVFVLLCGIFDGFGAWWVAYLYVWAVLWAITMLIPQKFLQGRFGLFVCPAVNCLFGLAFGALCAPSQALILNLGFEGMLAWIASGLLFDVYHGVGNLAAGFLVPPFIKLLKRLEKTNG